MAWIQHSLFGSPNSGDISKKQYEIKQFTVNSLLEGNTKANVIDLLTIINSGEANIDMRETTVNEPTESQRIIRSVICKLPTAMIANRPSTTSSETNVLTC